MKMVGRREVEMGQTRAVVDPVIDIRMLGKAGFIGWIAGGTNAAVN
jgi:hypothetical protein